MESVIGTDSPLDYVEFQLFPNQDRYDACACSGDTTEKVASGLLGQLVLHVPKLKDVFSRGSNASFQVQRPEDLDTSQWFTKATVTRFLHIVGSMDILNATTSIQNEISQLEEAKKFHLSLYTKDESEIASSDASKNELVRAMELRLTTLKTELATAFNRAAGTSSPKHICNMEKLAQHLGDANLRNTLRKFLEHCPMDQKVDLPIISSNDSVNKSDEKTEAKKPSGLDTAVKYGVSPAKAAEIERQNSTESEKSSDFNEDEQPSVERSRSLARSSSPRRSASPMRRVQIGRSGSRRATALTIKSLSYFPGRDRTQSYRDAYSSDEEGSEKLPKKSDNALRISVKDAISLFENKQIDHTSDAVDKRRSTLDASLGAKKSVLRRWSAGVQDQESVSESSQLTSENVEVVEAKPDVEIICGDNKTTEDAKVDEILHSITERMSKPMDNEPDILVIQHEEDTEKLTASAEWNRQKEAELNEMMKKMMQSKPGKNLKIVSDKNEAHDVTRGKRGGFYDQYKGKRDEKLRGAAAEKRTEKDAQFRAMQQVLEQRKAAMASANAPAVMRSKSSLSKPEKLCKSLTPSANTKKEPPKPTLAKKVPSKTSSSPVRKSWPSAPSPRASTGVSPAKTPCGTLSAGTTPTRRKPQPGPMGPQSITKVERALQQPKPKPVKSSQADTKKSTKGAVEKQQQPLLKNAKTVKAKAQGVSEKESLRDVSKPSFYNKMTKKSSVVPLESKPFLRKGSSVGISTGPVVKTKTSPLPKEPVKNPENLITVEENEVGVDTIDLVSQHIPERDVQSEDTRANLDSEAQDVQSEDTRADLDSKAQTSIQQVEQVITNCHDSLVERSQSQSELKTEAEEDLTISPTAWEEVDENEDSCIPPDDSRCEILSVVNEGPVATASPRVRHSLSQMLLQESAELDMAEWGNAEIPASIVYQKDAPKGLKKLLKFALKSKGDHNSTGWSSPSVFSEGEDDAEESKAFGKKKADTSSGKVALHGSYHGHQKIMLGEGHRRDFAGPQRSYAQSNLNNLVPQSSSNRPQDHISGAAPNTKATRSFFSLSAFKGNKTNEPKLR